MDLIADVLQQADVKKLRLATVKLLGSKVKLAAKMPSSDFRTLSATHDSKLLETVAKVEFKKDPSRLPGSGLESAGSLPPSREDQRKEAMRGLETVLATKMVEAMMPKDQNELYGEGTAGEIWRGFHIDSLGKALAGRQLLSTSADDVRNAGEDAGGNMRSKMIVPFAG